MCVMVNSVFYGQIKMEAGKKTFFNGPKKTYTLS